MTTPETTTPETTTPGSTAPKTTASGSTASESTAPETTTPGSTASGSTAPETTTPGSTASGTTTPGSAAPGTAPAAPPGGGAARVRAFLAERAPWRVYLTYALLWTLALEGVLAATAPGAPGWRLGPEVAAQVATVWAALVFVRLVDEQKDLAYDRVHNPGRPLPRGAVSVGELRVAMLAVTAAAVALTLWRSPALTLAILGCLAYVCFLVGLERWCRPVRERIFVNLAVSYAGQALLSGHIWLSYATRHEAGAHPAGWAAVLLCACVFLHFEFARKTRRRPVPGAELYSNAVGTRAAVALVVGTACAAALLYLVLLRPWTVVGPAALAAWAPLSALAFVWAGAERFTAPCDAWPAGPGRGFVAWFHLGLTAAALGTAEAAWVGL